MPELGKATYFLEVNSRQYDAALDAADEKAIASSNVIGRSFDKANASMAGLGAKAGVTGGKVATAEEGMAVAATESSAAISKAHASAEASYVRMSATGTKAYERMKLGPLAAIGVTLFEGIKTFKENANAAAILSKAYDNAGVHAHTTRAELKGITEELEKNTLASRAQIQGILALSLGFRDVADKGRFAQTVLDAAALTHRDGATIAKAYGRALEDPATGLTKLGRVGLAFSPIQKAMAKQITETQGAAKGLAYVEGLVENRTRGMAKAAADKAPWVQLFKQFKEIAASFTSAVLPAFNALLHGMNAHKTTVKVLVGVLVGLAAAYVAVKVAQKAWVAYTAFAKGVVIAWNTVALLMGKTNWYLADSFRAATRAERLDTAATAENTAAKLRNLAAGARAGAGNLLRGGATGAGVGALGIAAVGAGAIGILNHFKGEADKALTGMEQNEKRFNVKTEEALAYYAARVQHYVKMGWDKARAKTAAEADTFGHLGEHIGNTLGAKLAKGLSAQQKKIKAAMKSIMDGLKTQVVDSQAALNLAMQHGAPQEILKTLSQSASDAAYDAAHGAQGAAQAVRDAHEKILEKHKEWLDKMKGLASDHMDKVIQAVSDKVNAAKSKLGDAFGNLSATLFRAFDANTQAGLAKFDKALQAFGDKIQKAVTAANKKIDAALAKANASLNAQQGELTESEQKLKDMQDRANAIAQGEALSDAQGQLAAAKTPAERAAAERAVRDAQNAITMSALEAKAAIERKAKDAEFDAKRKQVEDMAQAERDAYQAQLDRMQKAYEARINQAKLDYESERELYKNHLQTWLNQELVWLQKHPQQWRRVFNSLVSVFGPDVKRAGKLIGRGFIGEFRDAVNDTAKKALKYNAALHNAAATLGRSLANGIVGGMATLAPKLYREMIHQVNLAFRQFGITYKIKSPSKKTEDEIGKPLGEGVVVGFAKAIAPLVKPLHLPPPSANGTNTIMSAATSANSRGEAGVSWGRATDLAHSGTGRGAVTVVQHITRTDPDPFQLAHEARFAADGAFG